MQEELITFETAKLAKEKGFGKTLDYIYPKSYKIVSLTEYKLVLNSQNNTVDDFVSAPTQSLLQKWLREVHNIYVSTRESLAITGELEYVCTVNGKYINHGIKYKPINRFDTWEEALEIGLYQALLLIK
jgi:hypothetical protein